MDSSFFGRRPSYSRHYFPRERAVNPPAAPSRPSKVVSVPVRFVDSEPEPVRDRGGSATKIQKVLRGYLVRKSLRKIEVLRKEVEEIEGKMSDPETVAAMRRDARERMKLNEMLMSVLFRLDSVRGVDSGVRDCRKAVIRRAIALQEKVDKIAASGSVSEPVVDDADGDAVTEEAAEDHRVDSGDSMADDDEVAPGDNKMIADGGVTPTEMCICNEANEQRANVNGSAEILDGGSVEDGRTESQTDSSGNPEEEEVEEMEEEGKNEGEGEWEKKEMLRRMMEDNAKMMGMMAELFERNDRQTQLLTALSQRVEQLERAFVCDKLRRKKRRNANTHCSSDTYSDPKKCWKK